ncbi:hypothetical protein L2E82_40694 [Cichorium intybus]|uniref:Uncharacterized protein n=1 Tax=Cichorium intybus TaxID=13427 RepID=A0ACB9ANE8_CICIN|nr:hypothetical protein L2E82_40694 [Cichorium intybus]
MKEVQDRCAREWRRRFDRRTMETGGEGGVDHRCGDRTCLRDCESTEWRSNSSPFGDRTQLNSFPFAGLIRRGYADRRPEGINGVEIEHSG